MSAIRSDAQAIRAQLIALVADDDTPSDAWYSSAKSAMREAAAVLAAEDDAREAFIAGYLSATADVDPRNPDRTEAEAAWLVWSDTSPASPPEGTQPIGTMDCPVCGKGTPHGHTESEVASWLDAQASRFGYSLARLARPSLIRAVEAVAVPDAPVRLAYGREHIWHEAIHAYRTALEAQLVDGIEGRDHENARTLRAVLELPMIYFQEHIDAGQGDTDFDRFWQAWLIKARAALAASPPEGAGREGETLIHAIGDLLAYGHAEVENALKARNRDEHQFWQGWNAALERVQRAQEPKA